MFANERRLGGELKGTPFTIERRLGGDLKASLICQVCQQPLSLRKGFLGFPIVTPEHPQREAICLHRDCKGTKKMTLWALTAVLCMLANTIDP
jgi:hypothetical protein